MPQAKTKKTAAKKPATKRRVKAKDDAQLAAFVLLDASASMSRNWVETIGSMNAYVRELATETPAAEVTLAVFDSMESLRFEVIRNGVRADDWRNVGTQEVHPRGNTPLYDAIGRFVSLAMKKDCKRTALVIMTDGAENSSTILDRATSTAMLDTCRAKGWQTVFLGNNFDAMPQASALNNNVNMTLSILPQNLAASMSTLAGYTASYGARGMAMNFTDTDRAQASRTTS